MGTRLVIQNDYAGAEEIVSPIADDPGVKIIYFEEVEHP